MRPRSFWGAVIIFLAGGLLAGLIYILTSEDEAPPLGDMVKIPAGDFFMGSDDEALRVFYDVFGYKALFQRKIEPKRKVKLKEFYIDRYEVTNAQYQKFVEATGSRSPGHWEGGNYPSGQADFPVYNVSVYDAQAYAIWAGKRLPTEQEWEKAARGTDGKIFPWGNTFKKAMTNTWEEGKEGPHEVGREEGDKSPYGVFDMAGNVSEWTATEYEFESKETGPVRKVTISERVAVITGGNWSSDGSEARADRKVVLEPDIVNNATGFRCAR